MLELNELPLIIIIIMIFSVFLIYVDHRSPLFALFFLENHIFMPQPWCKFQGT
jgi:hypothetical protein